MAEAQHLMIHKSDDNSTVDHTLEEQPARTDEKLVISSAILTPSPLNVHGAVLINLAAIIFLVVVVAVKIYIKRGGSLSTEERALYTLGTTIIASSIALFTTNQMRVLWLANIVKPRASGSKLEEADIQRANLLLGLGKWHHQLRFWHVSGSLMIAGLITAALVASVNPSVSLVHAKSYTTLFFDQSACFITSSSPQDDWYNWKLDNGFFLSLNASNPACVAINEVDFSMALGVSLIDDTIFDIYAYQVGGVPVVTTAIGTPFDSGGFFDVSFGNFFPLLLTPLFQTATACFPIVADNPVSCRRAGTVAVGSNEVMVQAGGCNISTPVFSVDPHKDGAGAAGVCTDGLPPGRATIVLGAVNTWAESLAKQMGIPAASVVGITSFSVVCEVDIAPSISTTVVTYSKNSPTNPDDRLYPSVYEFGSPFTVAGARGQCTLQKVQSFSGPAPRDIPLSSVLTDRTLAIGAAAHRKLLTENAYRDGTWPTLASFSAPMLAFNSSKNPLEDYLGLMSAIVLGAYWGSDTDDEGDSFGQSDVYNNGLRVGPGQWWALVYIVPEAYAVAVILYLFWKRRT